MEKKKYKLGENMEQKQNLQTELTQRFGKGFSRSSLQNMRLLFLKYEKSQSLIGKLTWTHYCELLSISDDDKCSFYEKECINSKWSVRELKRQINSSLFERLLLSNMHLNYYATEVNDKDDNETYNVY